MIELKHIFMEYSKDYKILYDINLKLGKSEKFVLLGEEGSGKTSLIRIILGLEKKFSGEALINGKNVKDIDFKKDINAVYVSSGGAFLEGKTVYKNMEYVLKLRKQFEPDSEIKIFALLKQFNLFNCRDIKAKNLDKYNRIMLQLARASLRDKIDLLCIDDVFINLSDAEITQVVKTIRKIVAEQNTSVIVATSSEQVAKNFGYKITKISLGSIKNGEN